MKLKATEDKVARRRDIVLVIAWVEILICKEESKEHQSQTTNQKDPWPGYWMGELFVIPHDPDFQVSRG